MKNNKLYELINNDEKLEDVEIKLERLLNALEITDTSKVVKHIMKSIAELKTLIENSPTDKEE